LLHFTDFLFRVTRFNDIKAAPFITDDEFRSVLTDSEAQGVIDEEEGQMIQAILEFSDAHVKEILIPRPDVVALSKDATVAEAITLFREHGFSRMPVFEEDLDHISGLLVMKDLLPSITKGELDRPARELARVPRYVPESMTIHRFVKDAQKTRTHLAVVVDEYGGTEGIVSLEDALEEVVGHIQNEDVEEEPLFDELRQGVYQVDGGLPLDELSELIGVELKDEEHETVAGFFIEKAKRLPEPGDWVEHCGVVFIVEKVDGKRVSSLRVEIGTEPQPEHAS
jgi:CBS domain containing-hemolysin-like protein